jgi:hypothetical protein
MTNDATSITRLLTRKSQERNGDLLGHYIESHREYLGHFRPSYTGSGTSCAKHSSVGSNIASGMAAAITTGHRCIFVSPNPHLTVGYMKQKPALV